MITEIEVKYTNSKDVKVLIDSTKKLLKSGEPCVLFSVLDNQVSKPFLMNIVDTVTEGDYGVYKTSVEVVDEEVQKRTKNLKVVEFETAIAPRVNVTISKVEEENVEG